MLAGLKQFSCLSFQRHMPRQALSAGPPLMIKELTSPLSTAVSLQDMSLSCPKHCKSLCV